MKMANENENGEIKWRSMAASDNERMKISWHQ
jgi:hypothetical protein